MSLIDLSRFAPSYTQEARMLELVAQPRSVLHQESLVVDDFDGYEAASEEFEYHIRFRCNNPLLKLNEVTGLGVALTIRQSDGDKRVICGVVKTCRSLGLDGGAPKYGGAARYEITLVPFTALLAESVQTRQFCDLSADQIAQAVLTRHLKRNSQAFNCFNIQSKLTGTYPIRSLCHQYKESDLHFIRRLLREDGVSYRYTHAIVGDMPVHTLELFDDGMSLPQCSQGDIRFHRAHATEDSATVTELFAIRTITGSISSLLTTEYKSTGTPSASGEAMLDQGNGIAGTLEHYDPAGAYYASSLSDLDDYARKRQQAKELLSKRFAMTSTVANLAVGEWFTLHDNLELEQSHSDEERQFTVLEIRHKGRNNLDDAETVRQFADAQDDPVYQNECVVVRRYIPIVPHYGPEFSKPTARGVLTGTVVGPAGEVVHTDDMGRIKVQLHCMRAEDHPQGNANHDEKSSTWVRWACVSAGTGFGSQFLPRIGHEVLIDFIDGDVDRMIAVAVIHNGAQINTRFSNVGALPTEKVLSGVKTQAHDGNGFNQTVYDDTPNEVNAQFFSSHAKTSVTLGRIGTPRAEGKATARGDGFEVYSEAAGAIRGAKSLLLTAEALTHGLGNQLHRELLLKTLDAALLLADQAGEQAAGQNANAPETGKGNQLVKDDTVTDKPAKRGHQTHLNEALHNVERGTSTDPKGTSGKGDQAGEQGIVAISAPDGIAIATAQSATLATGTNFDQVALRDTTQTTGRRWIHNVTESVSLFVNGAAAKINDTFKIIAGKGNINMQAQSGQIIAAALKDFTISSSQGKIVLEAPNEIYLTAGGGYIRIGSDIQIHNPGTQSQKAASFKLSGGDSANATLPSWKQPKLCDFQTNQASADGGATVAVG